MERVRKLTKTISHSCSQCGRCCRCRGDIYLTPLDVLRISKHFKMTCKEVIEKFCIRDGLEVCARTVGKYDDCIFLKKEAGGKTACAIYEVRPMKCYLYPLGATRDITIFSIDTQCDGIAVNNQLSAFEFARQKSNGRYAEEWNFLQDFDFFLETTCRDDEEAFEIMFYNETEAELYRKIAYLCYSGD